MTFGLFAKNTSQKIPARAINTRTVLQPVTHYTCPAGQKAHCKGRVQCTGRGAAASADFLVAGTVMYRWTASVATIDYSISPRDLRVGQFALFEFDLLAGETIVTDQNTGTNAEFNLWMEVTESPA